jgi:phosphoribosylaminoimidazole carboxylase PurE protein
VKENSMADRLVVILMGSKADEGHCEKIVEALRPFALTAETRIGSAHKTPRHLLEMLQAFEADPRPKVYITVAGRSNALSGFVDAAVSAPVIACPPPGENYAGLDILSSLRMPSGVAPAVVLEPANAALLAAKILGLVDARVRAAVAGSRKQAADKILADDEAIK